jgi:hypothetical protein
MTRKEIIANKTRAYAANTVGYNEAANKDSFNVGVSVTLCKAQELYEEELWALERKMATVQMDYDEVAKDMETLIGIINKYSPQE